MRTVVLTIAAYCLMAAIWCGDVTSPIANFLLWPNRLGIPSWPLSVVVSAIAAAITFWVPVPNYVKVPMYVSAVMTISIVWIGLYADHVRATRTAEFTPDALVSHSFFLSIRSDPIQLKFRLHAAALKKCRAYGWSYRTMGFYELPVNVAVNVIPAEWVRRCHMHRS